MFEDGHESTDAYEASIIPDDDDTDDDDFFFNFGNHDSKESKIHYTKRLLSE